MDPHCESGNEFEDDADSGPRVVDRSHLISVDELRAAGALDVPPEWRKSLGAGPERQRGLFADESLWENQEEEAAHD